MGKIFEGNLIGGDHRFGIVLARWNDFFGSKLLEGAKDALIRHGVDPDRIDVVLVPGSFEIALAAKRMAKTKRYDGIVCLGVLIRGATTHYDLIANEAAKGIGAVSLEMDLPIGFGVITCETMEQAMERCGSKAGNKGVEAALATLEMTNLLPQLI